MAALLPVRASFLSLWWRGWALDFRRRREGPVGPSCTISRCACDTMRSGRPNSAFTTPDSLRAVVSILANDVSKRKQLNYWAATQMLGTASCRWGPLLNQQSTARCLYMNPNPRRLAQLADQARDTATPKSLNCGAQWMDGLSPVSAQYYRKSKT
jgi:hypothetical protein